MLRITLLATALLGATMFSTASATPPGPQAAPGAEGDLVMQAKNKGPVKGPIGPIGPIGPPIGPVKPPKPLPPPPKGGKHWHRYPSGGIVVLGEGSYCAERAERCAGLHGTRTTSYRRCLRRAGC